MPQLANDKEITIARDHNGRALARLFHLRELDNAEERYSAIPAAMEGVDGIDPNHLDDPDQVIEDCLYSTATALAQTCKDESKAKILEAFLTSIVTKIVEIFGTRTKKVDSLSFIHKLLSSKKSLPFYKYTARSLSMSIYYPREAEAEPNRFYHETVATVTRELLKYHKIVWEVQPRDLIDFVLFVDTLQPAPLHSKEGKELIEAIATELLAYFRSGRPELSRYCGSVSNMRSLDEALLKKLKETSLIKYISQLGPTLAELFLRSPQTDRRKMGLTLMEHYIDEYSYNRFSKLREEEWKAWVNSHEVFEIVLADTRFCEEIVEKASAFFRNLKRYKTHEERVRLMVALLKQDITGCDRLSSFIRKELDYYYMDEKARDVLLEYLSSITNYSAVPFFFDTLQELLIRNDSAAFIERLYAVITRIMKQDYDRLGDSLKAKCLSAFKYILNRYLPVLKSKNGQTRQRILKEDLIQLFTDISIAKIILFNLTVIENEAWKAYSNNGFQTLLTDLVEKTGFFDNIFKYLQKGVDGRASEKDFVHIIKFVSAKIVSKQDATFRYIHIISHFPEVFEELIDTSGYGQIDEQMRKVFQLFKSTPTTPFHILTLTFERINHTSFLDYRKVPSLLQHRKEQKELTRSPKTLKQFQSLMQLLLETDSVSLRQQLCDYIISLYWNFKQCSIYSHDSGQEAFITFLTELLDNFEKDCQQFKDNPSLGKTLLVDMEFIEKALQFTDILGCGDFRPHKSLVSTSTMRLSVTNNVTFGDDVAKTVHRDFPSSMTLFEALTIIGLQFKCGPENIVLMQGGRFISPLFNCFSLEDLHLTNEEIIAEQNTANTLQSAELFQGKKTDYKSHERLRPEVINVITDVFNRFAFEGKMSLIECTNFIRKASGSECISSDRRVKDVFDFDTDNDGIITLPDFIEYYRKNFAGISSYYKDQMLKGLYNLRYRKNLTPYNEPLNISRQHYLMMRFKIVKSYPQLYDIFFRLAAHHQTALSDKAKKLLLLLPSCPRLNAEVSKPIIFCDNSQFQIYYKLISIENALSSVQGEAKAARIEQFLKNKNNQVIFGLLSQYHAKAGRSEFEARSLLICLRILRSLINIEQLSTSNPYTRKVESLCFPHLPPTTFFAEHTAVALQSRNIINFETLLVLQLTQEHVQLQPIITCCFNHQLDIRKIACHFLFLWSLKTHFALDLFTVPISEHNNEQWFQLLCGVIQQNSALNLTLLKENAINVLQKREESFQNQYDPLMYGYLKILAAIATKQRLESPRLQQIFTHLLNNTISQKNRALVFQLIRRQSRQIGYGYFDRMLSTILPSQQCLMRQRFVGIKNLGAICYINSILQQFFMVEQFRHMVLSKPVPHDLQPVEVNGRPVVDNFMFQLQKLYHQLEYGKKKYVVPRDFCFAYKNFEGQPINTSIQEDAHQFLNRLVQTAEEAFKKEGRLAELQELLMIKKLSEIECEVCKNRIDKYQQDYCLMIEVKNHDTLVDSLRKFTEQEAIADYFCEKCNKKMAKIYKRTYLNALPQIVILNLQRIVYDQQKGDKVKVHTQLSFPQEISFADFVKNDGPTPPTDYRLKGVVIHTGTSEGGHYYSLVKTKQYGWIKFNDQCVSGFDEKDLERETFGGFEGRDGWGDVNYSTNAYILFYQRANVDPKQFIEAENQFTQQLQKENTRLINQLQIHQESFFQAILASYQAIRPQSLDELARVQPFIETKPTPQLHKEYLQLIKIGHKAFSFLSVYTEVKQEIRVGMGRMLIELYFMLPEETGRFLKDCNINTYFQNMISDSSQGERETMKQTFLAILIIHIRYYGINLSIANEQNQLICDVLEKGLSYMQGKLFYSNITKVGAYINFWDLLARSEENTCIFLIQKGVLFRMLDLLMGKESTFMRQHPIAQDLPVNLAPFVFSCVDKLLEWKLSLKGRKVFLQSCIPTSSLQANIVTNHTFYRRIMRLKYDHVSLSNIITHYSYDDLEFSAMIAQFLITSINNHEQINDLPLFFKHINDFLMVKDGLQGVRCGWVLGIPQNKECSGKEEEYCLSYSDRSEVVRYISGIHFKKTLHLDGRRPLMELAYEKKSTERQLAVYIIKLILDLSVESDTVMQFILSMPPPNYFMFSYFDWMPDTLAQMTKDAELFLEKKMETLEQLRNLMDIVRDKVKLAAGLPVQKHIIGKKKKVEAAGRVIDKDYEFSLRRLTTYVLQNRPTGEQNESMSRKNFSSQSPSGIGHVFVYYRSKMGFESEAKDLKTADTLYILSGKTQVRLQLIFKGKLFKHLIITGEGDVSIVFPCEKEGEIKDLIDILHYQDERVQALPAEVQGVFGAQVKKEDAMEEEKDMMDPALPDGGFQQPKIKCGFCTFDNELTRDRCDMCDNLLFS